jgi:hypothetical protein
MTERRYRPGEIVAGAGQSLWHLLVVVDGRIQCAALGAICRP